MIVPRFWTRAEHADSTIDDGFLHPTMSYADDPSTPLAELAAPCLVLLGEPGTGKTTALREEVARLEAAEAPVLFVDLGGTRDESLLREEIVESDAWREWIERDGHLHIFLDALDEARLRIQTVARLLIRELGRAPIGRLSLRISCRSAERHRGLEEFLQETFGDGFEVRTLAPLRREDLLALAADEGIDAETFVKAVVTQELESLARWPLSAKLLIETAAEHGQLPQSRIAIYEQGLRLRSAEPNEDRPIQKTSQGQRFSTAMRIGAALVLSGRRSVSRGPRATTSEVASASDLAGGRERDHTVVGDVTFAVGLAQVEETLTTALFRPTGDLFEFDHATFAEFLAARWLAADLSLDQVMNLLTVETESGPRVASQLREVSSWLAGFDSAFLDRMIEEEPLIALRADLSGVSDDQRAKLVDALLQGVADESIDLYGWRHRSAGAQLSHPGIEERIGSVIADESADPVARTAACDLARACRLSELEQVLVEVALAAKAPNLVRVHAVRALGDIASDPALRKLEPLAIEPQAEDPDDELKGAAMGAVWPRTLTVRRLLKGLTPLKQENLLGLYKSFIWSDLIPGLEDRDLGVALRWAESIPPTDEPFDPLSDLREEILIWGWGRVEEPAVAKAYARVIAPLIKAHTSLLDHRRREEHPEVLRERGGRRAVVGALVPEVTAGNLTGVAIAFSSNPPLVELEDFDWLVSRLRRTIGRTNEKGWAELVSYVGMHAGRDLDVLELRELSPRLREESKRFDPIDLASEAAKSARESQAMLVELEKDREKDEQSRVDIAALIREQVALFGPRKTVSFINALHLLSFEDDQRSINWYEPDVTELHGWSLLDEGERAAIRNAAPIYLARQKTDEYRWFDQGETSWVGIAGYRAFRLIHETSPEGLGGLPPRVWKKWAPYLLAWIGGDGGERYSTDLFSCLQEKAPQEGVEWLRRIIRRDAGRRETKMSRFDALWSDDVEAVVLAEARRSALPASARAPLVAYLLDHDSEAGLRLAHRLTSSAAVRAGGARRKLALQVAATLADARDDGGWEHLAPLVDHFPAFARDLIGELTDRRIPMGAKLSPHAAGELFELTERMYPAADDPELQSGAVPLRAEIARWRDDLLRMLASAGTAEAVSALNQIAEHQPDRPGLRNFARAGSETLLSSSWSPPRPTDVVALSVDRARRWVRSDEELRDVVLRSIERAQMELQGGAYAVVDLWDITPLKPRPENALSHWLQRFFDRDLKGQGILVGRETEIRPGPGFKMGESLDLEVRAVAGERVEGAPIVSVIIEVKGCWNRHLTTAMETQLAERYLTATSQGIYLVGHFEATDWTSQDARRAKCGRSKRSNLQSSLDEQAAQLSQGQERELRAVVLDCSLRDRAAELVAA